MEKKMFKPGDRVYVFTRVGDTDTFHRQSATVIKHKGQKDFIWVEFDWRPDHPFPCALEEVTLQQ